MSPVSRETHSRSFRTRGRRCAVLMVPGNTQDSQGGKHRAWQCSTQPWGQQGGARDGKGSGCGYGESQQEMHLNVPMRQAEATLSPPTSAFLVLPETLQTCLLLEKALFLKALGHLGFWEETKTLRLLGSGNVCGRTSSSRPQALAWQRAKAGAGNLHNGRQMGRACLHTNVPSTHEPSLCGGEKPGGAGGECQPAVSWPDSMPPVRKSSSVFPRSLLSPSVNGNNGLWQAQDCHQTSRIAVVRLWKEEPTRIEAEPSPVPPPTRMRGALLVFTL